MSRVAVTRVSESSRCAMARVSTSKSKGKSHRHIDRTIKTERDSTVTQPIALIFQPRALARSCPGAWVPAELPRHTPGETRLADAVTSDDRAWAQWHASSKP